MAVMSRVVIAPVATVRVEDYLDGIQPGPGPAHCELKASVAGRSGHREPRFDFVDVRASGRGATPRGGHQDIAVDNAEYRPCPTEERGQVGIGTADRGKPRPPKLIGCGTPRYTSDGGLQDVLVDAEPAQHQRRHR